MHGINDMRPGLRKHMEFHRVAIAFQKENVIRIDGANGLVEPSVEGHDHLFTSITRLVDGIIACHPRMSLVPGGKHFPEVDHAVLEVLMLPEEGFVGRVVAMPGLILVAGQSMQVNDRVDLLFGTQVDHPIQVLEALFLNDKRLHIRLEMAIVDGKPQQVEPQGCNELGIVAFEEILQEAIEEEFVVVIAQHLADGLSLSFLVGRIAGDEILHVHPSAQAKAAQTDLLACVVDNGRPLCGQNVCWHEPFPLVVKLVPSLRAQNRRLLTKACSQATQQLTPAKDVQQDDRHC